MESVSSANLAQQATSRPHSRTMRLDILPDAVSAGLAPARATGATARLGFHLTDRYLNFWNRITARARAIRPDVKVVTYIYSYYRHPPRRERIEYPDNMLFGLVPTMLDDYRAWKGVRP